MITPENSKQYFVNPDSIVRQIWGKSDTILFIFAGAAAEFALNKAVDWLYFTGKLPASPLDRLFSTVTYARQIVFSEMDKAHLAIDRITSIHSAVETSRGQSIPDWAYRDVLYMLIYYSIVSYELLERKLDEAEKEEVFQVFYRLGNRMALKDLPTNYNDWKLSRSLHLQTDLVKSKYSIDLYKQYRKHLGGTKYLVLIESQKLILPTLATDLLGFTNFKFLKFFVPVYKLSRKLKLDGVIKSVLLPAKYKTEIASLDVNM